MTLSVLVALHNSHPNAHTLIHIKLLNQWIHTSSANLSMFKRHLEENNNTFSSGPSATTNEAMSRFRPSNFDYTCPYVYFAHLPPTDSNVSICYGLRLTISNSKTKASGHHSTSKKTALTLDGTKLPDENTHEFYQAFTGTSRDLEKKARDVEMIGHIIVQIEKMLEMDFRGMN